MEEPDALDVSLGGCITTITVMADTAQGQLGRNADGRQTAFETRMAMQRELDAARCDFTSDHIPHTTADRSLRMLSAALMHLAVR